MTVYVGMDVHRKRSQVAVVDDTGVPQRNRNLSNDPAQLMPILGVLPPGTPVAFEVELPRSGGQVRAELKRIRPGGSFRSRWG
jgi:hypothetical protein